MNITVEDFKEYVAGWLICNQEDYPSNLNMGNIKAALGNALNMIEDDQDGIVAEMERKEYYKKS